MKPAISYTAWNFTVRPLSSQFDGHTAGKVIYTWPDFRHPPRCKLNLKTLLENLGKMLAPAAVINNKAQV